MKKSRKDQNLINVSIVAVEYGISLFLSNHLHISLLHLNALRQKPAMWLTIINKRRRRRN